MLRGHMNDVVTLLKKNGQRIENIKAHVQPKIIFITDTSVPIEEDDYILRTLPNGLEERFLVVDRGFYSKRGSFNAHYQVKVKKESSPAIVKPTGKVIYNIHGPNARININSQDSSININNVTEEKLFEDLKQIVSTKISNKDEKSEIIFAIESLEKSIGTNNYLSKYQKFIALVANHMAIITPFIPALTQLITT